MENRLEYHILDLDIKKCTVSESNDLVDKLRKMNKDEVLNFIRSELTINGERLRFNMSGYESQVGKCTIHNNRVLERFAHLGIFDYTSFLTIDFYKGSPTIYFIYFYGIPGDEKIYNEYHEENFKLSGYTTSEIIYEIFKLTIFSDREKRRRI